MRNKIGAGKGSIGRRRGAKRAKYKLVPSRWRRRKTRRSRRRRDRQGSASTRLTYWDSRACNKQPDDKYQGPNTKHKLSDSLVYKKRNDTLYAIGFPNGESFKEFDGGAQWAIEAI